LDKVVCRDKINASLFYQLRARIISQPGARHIVDLLLRKGLLLRQCGQGKDQRQYWKC
jgi:hypothetical protein